MTGHEMILLARAVEECEAMTVVRRESGAYLISGGPIESGRCHVSGDTLADALTALLRDLGVEVPEPPSAERVAELLERLDAVIANHDSAEYVVEFFRMNGGPATSVQTAPFVSGTSGTLTLAPFPAGPVTVVVTLSGQPDTTGPNGAPTVLTFALGDCSPVSPPPLVTPEGKPPVEPHPHKRPSRLHAHKTVRYLRAVACAGPGERPYRVILTRVVWTRGGEVVKTRSHYARRFGPACRVPAVTG